MAIGSTDLERLKRKMQGDWGNWEKRALAELEFAVRLIALDTGCPAAPVDDAWALLEERLRQRKGIDQETILEMEKRLTPCVPFAKRYTVVVTGHAHIDMNWQWGYPETVSVTVETFRTMLRLLQQYPSFHFSQSQASTYAIAEEFAPELLDDIRRYIREGRWEVLASTWVENDRNMPGAESLSRQYLYTRRYLSRLLEVDPALLCIDFQPDTFGHSRHLPALMTRAGIRYFYHGRGYDKEHLYNWEAPDGSSVLVYREPIWYNADSIGPAFFFDVPEFCEQYGVDTAFRMLGVGDHGGGPSQRDIERLLDMQTWPLLPTIRFGSLLEYFQILEKQRNHFAVVREELNTVFNGCYTSQSRIKAGNRAAENSLSRAEALAAAAALETGRPYRRERFETAWRKVLFNQFHDILPGSCVMQTREHAMGEYQNALAISDTEGAAALAALAGQIDTSFFEPENDPEACSPGAGAGYSATRASLLYTSEQGQGLKRLVHVFNPFPYAWNGPAEITIWDYSGDSRRLIAAKPNGEPVPLQITAARETTPGDSRYWGHVYTRLLLDISLPAYGYGSYILDEGALPFTLIRPSDWRIQPDDTGEILLENEKIRARFEPESFRLVSLVDKASGREQLGPAGGRFRFLREDPRLGHTSWVVGRTLHAEDVGVHSDVRLEEILRGTLRSCLRYRTAFGTRSYLEVRITLDSGSSFLQFEAQIRWEEKGIPGQYIPQLAYTVASALPHANYRYLAPFGGVDRPAHCQDRASLGAAAALGGESGGLVLLAEGKYGYRGTGKEIGVDLLRGSFDPDPYPENFLHQIRFALGYLPALEPSRLLEASSRLECTPVFVSGTRHTGRLPAAGSFLHVSGGAAVAAVKLAEDEPKRLVVKLYEPDGRLANVTLSAARPIAAALLLDNDEQAVGNLLTKVNAVTLELTPHSIASVGLDLA